MKPTISNAFNAGVVRSTRAARKGDPLAGAFRSAGGAAGHPSALKTLLATMQADLRPSDFGWSLELSPIQALDAAAALQRWTAPDRVQFLVTLEQALWQRGGRAMSLADVAGMLEIPPLARLGESELVLNAAGLSDLVQTCQTSRLLVVAVEGAIEARDAQAIGSAIDRGASPLTAEMRALAAIEVLGERSLVLHTREKRLALCVVAANFRQYLAALRNRPADSFAAPEIEQIERLLDMTGALTVRPIETEVTEGSIDVGINTAPARFAQPAAQTLIYDVPSNTWHDEAR